MGEQRITGLTYPDAPEPDVGDIVTGEDGNRYRVTAKDAFGGNVGFIYTLEPVMP